MVLKKRVETIHFGLQPRGESGPGNKRWVHYTYMAAAQNVRSGSSPGPTHDPDLRSRPPIQTFRKDLIQTFDPDLWNDI